LGDRCRGPAEENSTHKCVSRVEGSYLGHGKVVFSGAVVLAQLAKRLLPTPEIRRSNPDIGKIFLIIHLSTVISQKRHNKLKKRPAMTHLKKVTSSAQSLKMLKLLN